MKRIGPGVRQLAGRRSWVVAFACVNLVLLSAWVWSRDGQTNVVNLRIDGDRFVATMDGRKLINHAIDAPARGGIIISLDPEALPSLPEPRGIDSVRVTDLRDGVILLQDDFANEAHTAAVWRRLDHANTSGGLLRASEQPAVLATEPVDWTAYEVELVLRNVAGIRIELRNQQDGGAAFAVRPYRHLDSSLTVALSERTGHFTSPPVSLSEVQTVKAMTAVLVKPYPLMLGVFLIAAGALYVGVPLMRRVAFPNVRLPAPFPHLPVVIVLGWAFGATLYLMLTFSEGVPHVPDELSYLRQAKVLASGRFAAPVPVSPDSFQFFYPAFDVIEGGKWASIYPFGHPLALAPSTLLGAPWIMRPILGVVCLALLYLFGSETYNRRTGLAAATLLTLSPFFLMTASNFMSHNTAAVFLLGALVSAQRSNRRPLFYGVILGACLGLLFNTRPLTGMAALLPFALFLATGVLRPETRREGLLRIGAAAAGGLTMLLLYFGYEYATSGNFLTLSESQAGSENFGFSGSNSLGRGLSNELTQLSLLVLMAHNWPFALGLAFSMLPFVLLSRNRWDWFLGAVVLCLTGAYVLYAVNGIMQGPRFWYEALPILTLLAIRGLDLLAGVLAATVACLRRLATEEQSRLESLTRRLALTIVLLLAAVGGYDWMFGNGFAWRVDLVPANAEALRNFNGLRPEFARRVGAADLENALVLVENCPGWQCYGSLYLENNVTLDGNVVFARNLEHLNRDLLLTYPGREVYVANYAKMTLAPYGGGLSAPLAADVASAFPQSRVSSEQASTHPELRAARDQRRKDDLARLVDAVRAYYDLTSSVPSAPSMQSLCGFEADAGCALKRVLDPLPSDPFTDRTYWYTAEGQSYGLYASLEEDRGDGCSNVPPHLAREKHVFCITGRVSSGSDSR